LIAKYQRRFPGFDEKLISMYARGMSTREIQGHLRELYAIPPQELSRRGKFRQRGSCPGNR
jgi:transposase-like protein